MLILPVVVGLMLLVGWCTSKRSQLRDASLIFLFCTAIGRPCVIPTGSMEPTIRSWDWVWLSHISMVSPVQRGDVVCFPSLEGNKLLCKRVVGLGGDTLEMRNGTLLRNGLPSVEPWAEKTSESWGPIKVAPGQMFVMGDHRSNSADSRYWGTAPADLVVGKVKGIAFPPQHWRSL